MDTGWRGLVFIVFSSSFIITLVNAIWTIVSIQSMNYVIVGTVLGSVVISFALVLLSYWVWQDREELEERLRKLEEQQEKTKQN